ncbi:MAG: hemolysin III family protein [Ruminococcaceae bacterium]|nr:hemolysin III family protein [Oscillospiraceae bacterium]
MTIIRKPRTKLKDRILPDYTRGEEIFNMVSHIVAGGFGVIALVLCVLRSALYSDVWAVVSSAIYGASLIILYTMSSVYHGLVPETAKKVMQVLDHCTIYFLIGGTYTPIVLCAIRKVSPAWAWTLFGIVWGLAAIGIVFAAIDHKKYGKFSMTCYIGMGWCVVIAAKVTLKAVPLMGLLWLLLGGIAYTIGAVIYGIGKKHRYMHSVFHIFCLLGSIFQFVCIFFYVI